MNLNHDEKNAESLEERVNHVTEYVNNCLNNKYNIVTEKIKEGLKFVDKYDDKGYVLFAFGMDFTASCKHSHGILTRGTPVIEYCNSPSMDFLVAVPLLIYHGKLIGILSFTDTKYYRPPYSKETHIAGEDLIAEFLNTNFHKIVAKCIFRYGRNPELYHFESQNKKKHINKFMESWDRKDYKEVVLFDDTDCNINNSNVDAYKVDSAFGFRFSDLIIP